jgi:outer membrane protein TolC
VIAFNLARGVISQEVNETLLIPEIQTISSLPPLEKPEYRLDTLAAKRSADASIANSIASAENSKPDLQVFGKVSTGGLNQDLGTSVGNSFTTRYPITQIGLRLNIPIDRAAVESTQKAYQLEAQSAELTYARKVQEQNSLWNNLIRGFEERKKRINIAASAEKLQLEKLQNEKKIHSAGRSTTYQILMFEQDYLGTQATKLQLMQDALSIYAQLKTFGGNK